MRKALRHIALTMMLFAGAAGAQPGGNLYQLPYTLVDEQGQSVRLAQWQGHKAFVTMEYATCQFICSIAVNQLKALQKINEAHRAGFEFIIISLDPEHDSPQAWKKYRAARGLNYTNWHYYVSNIKDMPAIAALIGINYWVADNQIMHDFRILRVDEHGDVQQVIDGFGSDLEKFVR
jgi:cytochrome oxidase Cu insertion factor (SCO1/SenC/PrrC family)